MGSHADRLHTILLADDEANLRTLVRTTLEGGDCRILEAASGTDALDLVLREHPDVVVLDVMMPGMTGLDVLRRMRSDPATAATPVVMLTATGQERDRERAVALGADAYLVKPFSPLELLQTVEELRARTASLAAAARAAAGAADDAATARGAAASDPSEGGGSQLALYARDLRQAFDAERIRSLELARANERLHVLDRLKTDFLAFISHELRTPLNSMAMVDLFDPSADPAEQMEMVELVRAGYERLAGLVRSGLDYFDWLARDRCRDRGTTEDVAALVAGCVQDLRRRSPDVAVELGGCDARRAAHCCEAHLRASLEPILDNAVKFSREPWLRIEVAAAAGSVSISVRDRGVGFPPELAEEIFRPFTVADPLHHSRGTALSLALARAILEAHGGGIRAGSPGRGGGATFTLSVPA